MTFPIVYRSFRVRSGAPKTRAAHITAALTPIVTTPTHLTPSFTRLPPPLPLFLSTTIPLSPLTLSPPNP